jgi:hypothetical protein
VESHDFDRSSRGQECDHRLDHAHISKSRYGEPKFALGFKVFGVLDGANFDVGVLAVLVEAEAGDPDLAVADHDSLRVDEEGVVLLLVDGVCDIGRNDAVVVLDEFFRVFDGDGVFAWVDLDGVVNERRYGSSIVLRDRSLEVGKESLNLDVISDGEIDGFIEIGWAGLGGAKSGRKEHAGE